MKVRPITIAALILSVFSLVLITIDWRAAILIAILSIVIGIRNFMTAD